MHLYIRSSKVYTEITGITLKDGYIPAVAEQWPPPSTEESLPIEPALWFKVLVLDSISIDCVRQAVMWNTDDAFSLRRSLNESGEFEDSRSRDRRKRISESMYFGGSECINYESNMERLYLDTEKALTEYASGIMSREKFDERIMQLLHTMVLPIIKLTAEDIPKVQEAYAHQEKMVTCCDDEVLQKQDHIEKIQKAMTKQRQTFIQELAIRAPSTSNYPLVFAQLIMTHIEQDIRISCEELDSRQEAVEHAKETYKIMPDSDVQQHVADQRKKRDSWYNKHQKLIFAREHLRDVLSNPGMRRKANSRSKKCKPTPLQNMYLALEGKISELQEDLCSIIQKKVLVISVKEAIKETLEELRVTKESLGVDVGVLGNRRPTDVRATSKVPKDWQTLAEQVADMVCEKKGKVAKKHDQFIGVVIQRCQAALNENTLLETSGSSTTPTPSRHSNTSRFYDTALEDSISLSALRDTITEEITTVRSSRQNEKLKKRSGIYLENKLYLLQHQNLGTDDTLENSGTEMDSTSVTDGLTYIDLVRGSRLSDSSKSSSHSTSSKKSKVSSKGKLSAKSSNSGSQQSILSTSSNQSKSSKYSSHSSHQGSTKGSNQSSLHGSTESGLTDFSILEGSHTDPVETTHSSSGVVMRQKSKGSVASGRSSFENSSDVTSAIEVCLPFRMSRFQYETLPYMDVQQLEQESRALVELEGSTQEPDMVIVHNTDKDYLKTTIDSLRIEVRDHFEKVCQHIQRKLKCHSDSSFKNIWLCYEPHFYDGAMDALVVLYEGAYSNICDNLKESVPLFMASDLDLQDSIVSAMLEDISDEESENISVKAPLNSSEATDNDNSSEHADIDSNSAQDLIPSPPVESDQSTANPPHSNLGDIASNSNLGHSTENVAEARANTPRVTVLKDSGIYDEDMAELENIVEDLSPELWKFVENNAFPGVSIPHKNHIVPELTVDIQENQVGDSSQRSSIHKSLAHSPGGQSLKCGPSPPKDKLQKVHIHQAGDKSPLTVLLSRRTWPVIGEIPVGVECGVEALSLQPLQEETNPAKRLSPLPNQKKPSMWSNRKTLKLMPPYLERFQASISCIRDAIHSSVPLVKLQHLTRCLREINQQIQSFQEEFKMKDSSNLGICADDLIDILVIILCNCNPTDTARLYPHLMLLTDILPPFFEGGPFSFSLVQFTVAFQFIQERLLLQSRQHSWSLDGVLSGE